MCYKAARASWNFSCVSPTKKLLLLLLLLGFGHKCKIVLLYPHNMEHAVDALRIHINTPISTTQMGAHLILFNNSSSYKCYCDFIIHHGVRKYQFPGQTEVRPDSIGGWKTYKRPSDAWRQKRHSSKIGPNVVEELSTASSTHSQPPYIIRI